MLPSEDRVASSRMAGFVLPAMVALVVLSLIGCTSRQPTEASVPTTDTALHIRGAGATFPSVLYKAWFKTYQSAHPDIAIEYEAVGSGEGVRRFIGKGVDKAQQVDFGASDAAMTDAQMSEVPQGVALLPMTAGNIVLVYNVPGLTRDLRLSRKAYAAIFLGEITTWNDPRIAASNPGVSLPKLTIAPVVRQDSSGTTYAFTKHLDAISETWRARYGAATIVDWPGRAMRAAGNEGVAARVQQSEGAIGYVGYEFARKIGLKMAAVENKAGHMVAPTSESGAAAFEDVDMPDNLRLYVPDPTGASAYPIVTFSWILLRRDNSPDTRRRAMIDLFRWCLTEGQQYAPQFDYLPLPPNVRSKALSALAGADRPQ